MHAEITKESKTSHHTRVSGAIETAEENWDPRWQHRLIYSSLYERERLEAEENQTMQEVP